MKSFSKNSYGFIFKITFPITATVFLICVLRRLSSYELTDQTDKDYQLIRLRDGPYMADDPWLISYANSNYLISPSIEPYKLSFTTSVISNQYKQWQMNDGFMKFIKSTFKNKPPGFFIEAGALDGEHYSNTLWLEVEKKWTGLLIEPDPTNCHYLLSKKRKAFVSCSCISPHKYAKETLLEMPSGEVKSGKSGLLTWWYKANSRSMESRFHTFQDNIQETSEFTYVPVQCFPLQTYLYALNVTTVDLLSLDTQGGEKNMLSNFPFDKIKVKYILVEYFKRGSKPRDKDEEFVQMMESKGFELVKLFENQGNYIFTLL